VAFVLNAKFLAKQMELIIQGGYWRGRRFFRGRRILPMIGAPSRVGSHATILEYEKNAADCRHTAAQMKDPQLKKRLEDMAEVWERFAGERRQGIVENGPDKGQRQTEKREGPV